MIALPPTSGMKNTIHCGDCLDVMYWLWRQGVQVDAIITDLPYGTTACSWDEIIPFAPMWEAIKRILKPRGVFVTTTSQPFTSLLTVSNLEWFKYLWYWEKTRPTGFVHAKNMPMRNIEEIAVFSPAPMGHESLLGDNRMNYYPQDLTKVNRVNKQSAETRVPNYTGIRPSHKDVLFQEFTDYPTSLLKFDSVTGANHPTQKPVDLYSYLVRTYTQPGELVLDITCGSGTTGVACVKTGRDFILIDSSQEYCDIAHKRVHAGFVTVDVAEGVKQPSLFKEMAV